MPRKGYLHVHISHLGYIWNVGIGHWNEKCIPISHLFLLHLGLQLENRNENRESPIRFSCKPKPTLLRILIHLLNMNIDSLPFPFLLPHPKHILRDARDGKMHTLDRSYTHHKSTHTREKKNLEIFFCQKGK